jgi:hypothetical protein
MLECGLQIGQLKPNRPIAYLIQAALGRSTGRTCERVAVNVDECQPANPDAIGARPAIAAYQVPFGYLQASAVVRTRGQGPLR